MSSRVLPLKSVEVAFAILGIAALAPAAMPQQTVTGQAIPIYQTCCQHHDWINVKTDFGAVGDGNADDTLAFADAIAAYETSKAAFILVPAGTYLVDSLEVVGNVHLTGAGKGRTIIKARTAGNGAGIVRRDPGVTVQQLVIEHLQLADFQYGLDLRAINYSEFHDLYIVGCETGIYMGRRNSLESLSMFDTFVEVRVIDSTAFSLDVDTTTAGDLVNQCQFYNCIFDAHRPAPIRFRGNGGNGLAGNAFHGCGLDRFVSLDLTNCSGLGWYGGYIEQGSINIHGQVGGVAISGAYFNVVGGDVGIRIGTDAGQPVNGVTIGSCTFAGSVGTGIEIRPDIGASSSGIVLLPNDYIGDITPLSDLGSHAELTVTPGAVKVAGYISVSNTNSHIMAGVGSPEGVVSADVGSIYLRTGGGAGTTLWVKESGGSSTFGWASK
jgi:hypothetical protein